MNLLKRVPIIAWIGIATVVLIVVGVVFFTKNAITPPSETTAAKVQKEVPGTKEYPIVGRDHVPEGTTVATYNSNPPSSGPHWFTSNPKWPAPAPSGIYDHALFDEQLVHNLEHGYVWVSYNPKLVGSDLSQASSEAGLNASGKEVVNSLKDIVNKDKWKVVLEPRDKDDSMIALAAWGRVLKLDSPDYNKIKDFIKTYRDTGPETTQM